MHSSAINMTDSELEHHNTSTRPATQMMDADVMCHCHASNPNIKEQDHPGLPRDIDSRQEEYINTFGRYSRKSKDMTPPRNSTIPRDNTPSTHTWKSSTMPRRYSPSPLTPKQDTLPSSPPPYVHPKDKDCECQCDCRSSYYHSHEVSTFYAYLNRCSILMEYMYTIHLFKSFSYRRKKISLYQVNYTVTCSVLLNSDVLLTVYDL